jgi:anti-anti-sigma factor
MNDENILSQDATTVAVAPDGDLVAAKLPALRSQLRELIGLGMLHLTVDLAATRMVDSAGIGLLISAHNSLKKAGGDLKIINASKDIFELLRTMRIHQHFSVSGS